MIDADQRIENESGGHRIQRNPPTERANRIHTSTVTVAVVREYELRNDDSIPEKQIRYEFFSGTGKGGQNRNKVQNCVRAIHIPTGTIAVCQGRDRSHNIREATTNLVHRLRSTLSANTRKSVHGRIRGLMGSGERGDKIRTYRFQDNVCKDHRSNKRASTVQVMAGEIWRLW
jgi:peptide chain release factor 1